MSWHGVSDEAVEQAPVRVSVRGMRADVVLGRPEKLNALSSAMLVRLERELLRLDADNDVHIVVLRGDGGRAFSVGFDLNEARERRSAGVDLGSRPDVTRPGELPGFDALRSLATPVIAAVDGYCLGGGLELALLCDLRVATRASSFAMPEARVGTLGGEGVIRLSRLMPEGEALLMHLTARHTTAERAHQVGLVQVLVDDADDLDQELDDLVADVLACSPVAVQFLKRIVREGRELSSAQQWHWHEQFSSRLAGTGAGAEGANAFLERRPPRWGRTDATAVSETTREAAS